MIEKKHTVSDEKAAKIGLFIIIPAVLTINIFFAMIWRENLHIISDYYIASKLIENMGLKIFKLALPFIIFLAGMITHELLHFLPYIIYAKKGCQSVEFGFKKCALYMHSKEPVKVYQYRIITILPSLLLGFIPLIISFIYGFPWLWMFAFTAIIVGTGDYISLYYLMKIDKNELIMDHPTKIGFYRYTEKDDYTNNTNQEVNIEKL